MSCDCVCTSAHRQWAIILFIFSLLSLLTPPACIDYLSSTGQWSRLATVRAWSCIGAPFQIKPAQKAHPHLPNLQFYNSYAPTENSLVTTCHRLTEFELTKASLTHAVPIGTCVPGWVINLLDETEDPKGIAPPSLAEILPSALTLIDGKRRTASGVVYVRGPGVFVGYLNRPDLTEAAMLRRHALLGNDGADALPASTQTPHGSLFRSGDVCHYDERGELGAQEKRCWLCIYCFCICLFSNVCIERVCASAYLPILMY